eukprot:3841617-Alexandrium_andersonii.AAC.1
MSASLVGSEMCIRDRIFTKANLAWPVFLEFEAPAGEGQQGAGRGTPQLYSTSVKTTPISRADPG